MSIRRQILNELESVVMNAAKGLFGYAERESLRRRANPDYWQAFHTLMNRRLPKVRWAARLWHRAQARRYTTFSDAGSDNPIACALQWYCA